MHRIRWAVGVIAAGVVLFMASTFLVPASAAVVTTSTRDECIAALSKTNLTAEQRTWLEMCRDALAPEATPTPTGTPSSTMTPTPTPTTPPATSVPPTTTPPVVHDTYYVDGNKLRDPNGDRVIPRGVENSFWNVSWLPYASVDEAAKTGANTFRILPYYRDTPSCSGCTKLTIAQIENLIQRGIAGHMLVDVAIDGGDPAVYLLPEVKTLLFKYKNKIVIHAKGESYESTDAEWRTNSISVVTSLRNAGYTMPLYIMSKQGGRDLRTIINEGANVMAADPIHNLVFGWQAYWGSGGGYQSQQQMSLTEAMNSAASLPFPVQVGMIYRSDPWVSSQTVPFQDLMRLAQELGLGWLWWDWRTGADNLTTDGFFGHWAKPNNSSAPCASPCNPNLMTGQIVALDDPNSISHTAVRTSYMLAA